MGYYSDAVRATTVLEYADIQDPSDIIFNPVDLAMVLKEISTRLIALENSITL